MEPVRTPDERFAGLPGWPWDSRYDHWDGLRLARVDEGDGAAVVLLHGEPTWGYLYRKVLPPLLGAGHRVVVPDLPGFGRSDKPTERAWFTYDRLVASFDAHVAMAGLDEPFTLVVHDWGGPIGLRWAVDHPDRVARLVILNTLLYAPGGRPSDAWLAFRDFVARSDELPVGMLVRRATATGLDDDVAAAYEAPFHARSAQAGALSLPLLVPTDDAHPAAAEMWRVNQALGDWHTPTLMIWGEDDPILPLRAGERWAERIPGVTRLVPLSPAAHFLQEDQGERIGELVAGFVGER